MSQSIGWVFACAFLSALTLGCSTPATGLSDHPIMPIAAAMAPNMPSLTRAAPKAASPAPPRKVAASRASSPVAHQDPLPTTLTFARSSRPAADLRVMSFNIRTKTFIDLGNGWAFRKDLLVETVEKFNPDVLGTQECRMAQARDLERAMRGYEFIGVGRNDGDDTGEMCGIFYKATKFQKLDGGHFWLSDTPDEPGSRSWGTMFPRMVSWVKLRPRAGGEDFYFFNAHLDIAGKARNKQAAFLRQQITRIARNAPAVVAGDFNDGEGTTAYRAMTARGNRGGLPLIDTFRAFDPTPDSKEGTRHAFSGRRSGERIDWILATPHFTTLAAEIDRSRDGGRYPSDHFPVTAVLRFKPALAATRASEPQS